MLSSIVLISAKLRCQVTVAFYYPKAYKYHQVETPGLRREQSLDAR